MIYDRADFRQKLLGTPIWVTQRLELSADASAVDLEEYLIGGVLYEVEIYASADDAFTFTLNTGLGTEMCSLTTTSATSGEYIIPAAYFAIKEKPNYTLSGLGSGTVTIDITVWVA